MAQSQVQARDEKPGKNMLWGGRFTGSFVRLLSSLYYLATCFRCCMISYGMGESLLMRWGCRWDGSSYGIYGISIVLSTYYSHRIG